MAVKRLNKISIKNAYDPTIVWLPSDRELNTVKSVLSG